MTQTRPPTSPSDAPRARPQLFGASPQPHADFENSILATIDGGQARLTRKAKRPRKSRVPMILLSVAALGAGVYAMAQISPPSFSMAWFQGVDSPEAAPVTVTPPPAMPDTQVAQAEPAPQAPAPGAAIEVVPAPPVTEVLPPPTPDATPPEASDGVPTVPLALSTSEVPPLAVQAEPPAATAAPELPARPTVVAAPTTPSKPSAQAEPRKVRPQAHPPAPPPKSKTRVAKKPAANEPGAESDAALLAAVLPHFQRPEPTSRAFEQRCGQLTGSAAASCRRRFCSGRQGADTACPDPEVAPLPTAPANSFE